MFNEDVLVHGKPVARFAYESQ
ncbi:MAG: hypothetical protein MUR24_06240 [Oceanospirillaceae bacterium]|nr:hypothetical protein [Oceanospirillaceae bacterium]